jgi:endonuclease-3
LTTDGQSLLNKALEAHRRLLVVYGEQEKRRHDAMSTLVNTIISQNTNDVLRDRAYDRLVERYPTWQAMHDAPVASIQEAIQVAGLGGQKAQRIKEALQRISSERGEFSLEFLRQMPVAEAKSWLVSFKGIGPKTAAIILLFALDMPSFPVDTHVHRVCKRLGLTPEKATREKSHEILEAMLPPSIYYAYHLNIISHGREVCQARRPRCELCTLQDICAYHATMTETEQDGPPSDQEV